jgi:hypothetical protein
MRSGHFQVVSFNLIDEKPGVNLYYGKEEHCRDRCIYRRR